MTTMDPAPEVETNESAARRFVERALGAGDMTAFNEIVADHAVIHTALKPNGPIRGKAEYGKVLAETMSGVFSDGDMTIDDLVSTADGRVLVRFTANATHTGPLWGVGPTGRRICMKEIHLMRFEDGKLVENWVGGLNPLEFEMLFAPAISAMLFEEGQASAVGRASREAPRSSLPETEPRGG